MDVNELKAFYEKMLIECETHIDSDGDASINPMGRKIKFEMDGPFLCVTFDVMAYDEDGAEIRQYAHDNPAYFWMDGAYLVCAMRECGWKMMPYSDHPMEGLSYDLHNGSGVQIFFEKV